MGVGELNLKYQHTVTIAGRPFTLKTKEKLRLEKAAKWLNKRIEKLSLEHPLMNPTELYLLLALELSFERQDFTDSGKALLNETDELLKWMENQLR